MDPVDLAAAVAARYDEVAAAYRQLLAVAGKIKERLLAGEADLVQSLLTEQTDLMAAVDRCNEAVAPLRRELAACYGYSDLTLGLLSTLPDPPPPLAKAGQAMRRVAGLLEELASIYEGNQQLLQERLGLVRTEQAALVRGKSAIQAYREAGPSEARFVDRRS
jgi:hypothetical protein